MRQYRETRREALEARAQSLGLTLPDTPDGDEYTTFVQQASARDPEFASDVEASVIDSDADTARDLFGGTTRKAQVTAGARQKASTLVKGKNGRGNPYTDKRKVLYTSVGVVTVAFLALLLWPTGSKKPVKVAQPTPPVAPTQVQAPVQKAPPVTAVKPSVSPTATVTPVAAPAPVTEAAPPPVQAVVTAVPPPAVAVSAPPVRQEAAAPVVVQRAAPVPLAVPPVVQAVPKKAEAPVRVVPSPTAAPVATQAASAPEKAPEPVQTSAITSLTAPPAQVERQMTAVVSARPPQAPVEAPSQAVFAVAATSTAQPSAPASVSAATAERAAAVVSLAGTSSQGGLASASSGTAPGRVTATTPNAAPKASNPYHFGQSISVALETPVALPVGTGGQQDVFAHADDGSLWHGTARLDAGGRVQFDFDRVQSGAGQPWNVTAQAFSADGPGVGAQVSSQAPDAAQRIVQGVLGAVQQFAQASLQGSTTVSGGVVSQAAARPNFWTLVGGSVAGNFVVPQNASAVSLARVAGGTALTVRVMDAPTL